MKRTFAIGDIHGGLRALKQVLERANIDRDDKLIFLGDYVDGWSESPQMLDFLIEFCKTHDCTFLRGNHDDLLMQYLKGGEENELWTKHGGAVTIKSYSNTDEETRKRHIKFLENLKDYYIDKENRLFVHAGFTSWHGVDKEFHPRMVFWDRTLWETALAFDPSITIESNIFPRRFGLYKEIFIGHTPVTRIEKTVPQQRANVWNVDTGAGFDGPVTMLEIHTKEYFQSDPLPQLYPDEEGRNN